MEDSILKIINYLFKKSKIDNSANTSINSFFDNGLSFPQFVALSFHVDEIPKIIKNPELAFHKNVNNNTALHFLFEHNREIADISPSYKSDKDKINLLSLILTKQCFLLNIPLIIDKYNLIIGKESDFLTKKIDLIKSESIVKMLNVLTDGKVTVETDFADFDSVMEKKFDLAGAPLVINKSSLDFQNHFLFLIQYEILFDFYQDKINQIFEKEISENPEKKKKLDKLKEEEKKNELKIIQKKDKQKKIKPKKQKVIDNDAEQIKIDLQSQKEIERRQELEKQIEQQKKEDLEQMQKQKELEEQNKTITDKDNEVMFSDFDDNTTESEIETDKLPLEEDKKSTDSEDEFDKKSTDFEGENDKKSSENKNNDENSASGSELTLISKSKSTVQFDSSIAQAPDDNNEEIRKRTLSMKGKLSFDDMKTFSSSNANTTNSSDSSEDLSFDFESTAVHDYDSDDNEEENNIQIKKPTEQKEGKKGRIKRKRKSAKLDSIDDDKILKVIGFIENKTFNNIHEAIENNGIPKFVMHVLSRKHIRDVCILEEEYAVIKPEKKSSEKEEYFHPLSKNELKNIKAVICYLSKKEPKFKVLLFDFNNPVYIESSAYLFYRNFLSFFFLKSSKKEMFQRVVNILFNTLHKNDINNEKTILTNWSTYVNLGFFLCNKTLYFDSNFDVEFYFEKVNIPQIVDKNFFLRLIDQPEVPISIYCQLQFIFDRLDKPKNPYHIIEIFSKAMRTINMKVPKSDVLASRIRAKNVSLILQNKEYKNYVIQKKIYQSIVGYDPDEEEKEIESNKVKMPSPPPPFNEREHNVEIINSIELFKQTITQFKPENAYWDPPDFSFNIDNGILYRRATHQKRKEKSQADWTKEMEKIFINKKNIKKGSVSIISLEEATLYKFFIYNKQTNEWEQNIDFLNLFAKDKNFSNETKTPLVLFMNSNEKDLRDIAINSKIMIDQFPVFDDNDQIFVYGFGDKFLEKPKPKAKFMPKKHSNTEEIECEYINPIFLFLHLPHDLAKYPKISTIIYSIYIFLCFICDIEIIILNKEYYDDQIDFIKNINVITHSCKEEYKKEPDKIISKKSFSELHLLSDSSDDDYDENEVDYDDMSDDYDFNDEIGNEENISDIKNNYLSFSDIKKVFTKKRKTIVLFNDEKEFTSTEIYQKFNASTFFNNKKLEIDPLCQCHYINVKDPNSYKSFINNLNDLCLSDENSTFSDIKKNFRFTKLTKIGSNYINLKNDKSWETTLYKLIHNRYKSLKGNDAAASQLILEQIRNEILNYSLSIDIQFQNKCDEILSEIRTNESQDYLISFKNEIENSSELNLNYLQKIINNEKLWLENEKDNLKNSHVQFLKNEFFNIIKMIYPYDGIKSIYEEYKDILYDQIQKDLNVIDEYFNEFTKKQALDQNNKRTEDKKLNNSKNKAKRGTNYAVREAELTREIKVTVQVNKDLTSEILQDF